MSIRKEQSYKSRCTKQGYIGSRETAGLSRLFDHLLITSPGFNAVSIWQVRIKAKTSLFSVEEGIKVKALEDIWVIQSAEVKVESPLRYSISIHLGKMTMRLKLETYIVDTKIIEGGLRLIHSRLEHGLRSWGRSWLRGCSCGSVGTLEGVWIRGRNGRRWGGRGWKFGGLADWSGSSGVSGTLVLLRRPL